MASRNIRKSTTGATAVSSRMMKAASPTPAMYVAITILLESNQSALEPSSSTYIIAPTAMPISTMPCQSRCLR